MRGYELKVESRTEKAEKQRREIDELGLEIDRVRSRAKMLDDLEKNMEGYSGSVKAVMREVKRGTLRGIEGVLSQLINVEEQYSVAIETALGAALQNIVTQTENDAKRAINFLKDNKSGRATFLPLTSIKNRALEEKGLDDCFGYVAVASELVGCDKKYNEVIGSLLGRTVVVEDMDCAISIAKKYSHKLKLVTLDGQVINPGGSMTGGSRAQNAGILSRASEIERLNNEVIKLTGEFDSKQADYKAVLADLSACRADLSGTQADLTRAQEDVIRREGELKLIVDKLEDTLRSIDELADEKANAGERLAALNATVEDAKARAKELEEHNAALRLEIEQANSGRARLGEDESELQKAESKAKMDILSIQKDTQAKLEAVALLRHRIANQGIKVEDLNREIGEIAQKSCDIRANIAQLEEQAVQLRNRSKDTKADIQGFIDKKNSLDARASLLRQEERAKSADREKLGG